MYRLTDVFARANGLEIDFDFEIDYPIPDHLCGPACDCDDEGHDHGDGHIHLYPHDDPMDDKADPGLVLIQPFDANGLSDTPAGPTTTLTLTNGVAQTGELEISGDRDWFEVTLEGGRNYTIRLDGTDVTRADGTTATALEDPYLYLVTADGTVVASNDDGGGGQNSLLNYASDADQTLYIVAAAYAENYTGGYSVEIDVNDGSLPTFTIDEIANYLLPANSGRVWGTTTISYNYESIPADVRPMIEVALQYFEDVSDLTFNRVTSGGDITFIDTQNGAYAQTSTNGSGNIVASTINISQTQWIDNYGTDFNTYSLQTYIHEIGHALGLGHSGPYNGSATYGVDNVYTNDTWGTTVMSYFNQSEAGWGTRTYTLGLQAADVVAIQNAYGVDTTTRNGDTVYGFNATESDWLFDFANLKAEGIRIPSFAIFDTGGIDTFDLSGFTSDQVVSLVIDTWSSIGERFEYANGTTGGPAILNGVSIARGTVIENAIGGSGNDVFTGNTADNVLTGNAGDDIFTGGTGNDTLIGGSGIDIAVFSGNRSDYTVTDNGNGTFTVSGADGTDTLENVERVRFDDEELLVADAATGPGSTTIDGTSGDDILRGTVDVDIINGFDGNDRLYGDAGADTLDGGDGDDYLFTDGLDTLIGGEGFDRVRLENNYIALNITLDIFSGLENFVLGSGDDVVDATLSSNAVTISSESGDDTLIGSVFADNLIGGAGNDNIVGGDGNDRIDGLRGTDTLDGGYGNDIFFVDDLDTIDGGAGYDRIFIRGYAADGSYIVGSNGIEFANGNIANDSFDGSLSLISLDVRGQSGNDNLLGGTVGDFLYGGPGSDTVNGREGNDFLYGGTGRDLLAGGDGNDYLFFDDEDKFVLGGDGYDRAYVSSYSAGVTLDMTSSNIEFASGGTGDDTFNAEFSTVSVKLLGRAGNDTLISGSADDLLYGGDGDDMIIFAGGSDLGFGQAGTDMFKFRSNWGDARIVDFEDGTEILDLDGTGIVDFSELTINDLGARGVEIVSQFGDTILLDGVDIADIMSDDFIFDVI